MIRGGFKSSRTFWFKIDYHLTSRDPECGIDGDSDRGFTFEPLLWDSWH